MPRCAAIVSAASVQRPALARALASSVSRVIHSSVQMRRWFSSVWINGDMSMR